MATRFASWARAATSSGEHSPSDAVEWQCRSTCAVRALRGGPRGLRLAEQLEQLAIRELAQGRLRIPASHGREPREPAPPGGAGAALEDHPELILGVDGVVAGRRVLPRFTVDRERAPGLWHHASAAAVRGTSDQSSQASGA